MWIIIRTKQDKEAFVAAHIGRRGYEAWVPAQIIVCRPSAARRVTAKAQLAKVKELPILPRRVFVKCPGSEIENLSGITNLVGIEFDAEMQPVSIPDDQIKAFMATLKAENTAALALSQNASRKQKAKWRSLHDALVEMIEGAKAQLEQAA